MRKTPLRILNNLVLFLIFVSLSYFIYSCKKSDVSPELSPEPSTEVQSKFFDVPATASLQIKTIAAGIKKHDSKYHFLDRFIKRVGYPRWDKAKIVNLTQISITGRLGSDSTGEQLIYVPFVKDSANYVNSVLAVKMGLSDTSFRMLQANRYRLFGYDTIDHSKWNARDVFRLFTSFDKAVFGHSNFLVKDLALFNLGQDTSSVVASIVNDRQGSSSERRRTERIATLTEQCVTYQICENTYIPAYARMSSTQSGTCFFIDICSSYDDGLSGGGGGVNGWTGGGQVEWGSGGGYWEDPCGGGGENRISTDPDDPNDPNCGTIGWTPVVTSYPIINSLINLLVLNNNQAQWLTQHLDEASDIYSSLQESLNRDPVADNEFLTVPSTIAIAASKMTIDAAMNNLINGPYDANHWNLIKVNVPGSGAPSVMDPVWWAHFSVQVAILKLDHPEWSTIRLYWEASKELIHVGLDVIGMMPVVGEVADLANGIIYTIEGDGLNATLSFAATVPLVGWAATTAKYAKKTIFALDGTKRTLQWLKKSNGVIEFGDRGLLRKVLGIAKGENKVAHHIIPWEAANHPLIQRLAKGKDAFHLNERYNGRALSFIQHNGSHANYNAKIITELNDIANRNLNDADAFREVKNLIDRIANAIDSNPSVSINNLNF